MDTGAFLSAPVASAHFSFAASIRLRLFKHAFVLGRSSRQIGGSMNATDNATATTAPRSRQAATIRNLLMSLANVTPDRRK